MPTATAKSKGSPKATGGSQVSQWRPVWKEPPPIRRAARSLSPDTLRKVDLLRSNPGRSMVWGDYSSPTTANALKRLAREHGWNIKFTARRSPTTGRVDVYAVWDEESEALAS